MSDFHVTDTLLKHLKLRKIKNPVSPGEQKQGHAVGVPPNLTLG